MARQDAPRLGDGIDLAFVGRFRAKRAPVVIEAATVPLTVPAGRLQRLLQRLFVLLPPSCASKVLLRAGDRDEVGKRLEQEPAEPHALSTPGRADPVHAVVPVPAQDERQATRAGAFD